MTPAIVPFPVPATAATIPAPGPRYQLRVRRRGPADADFEIWRLPSPTASAAATRSSERPERIAGLGRRNLEVVEHRVLKRLARAGIRTGARGERAHDLDEDLALTLGLLFRALAPMRSLDRMRAVCEGIEAMEREEAAYWLGMAMHRKHPRRVLTALRCLLTDPRAPTRLRR